MQNVGVYSTFARQNIDIYNAIDSVKLITYFDAFSINQYGPDSRGPVIKDAEKEPEIMARLVRRGEKATI